MPSLVAFCFTEHPYRPALALTLYRTLIARGDVTCSSRVSLCAVQLPGAPTDGVDATAVAVASSSALAAAAPDTDVAVLAAAMGSSRRDSGASTPPLRWEAHRQRRGTMHAMADAIRERIMHLQVSRNMDTTRNTARASADGCVNPLARV